MRAIKCVSLAEQHLQDHFPLFPVMPGVLMLEALTQASSWLIRASQQFKPSMVVLYESRNVKFQDFVAPGDTLEVVTEILKAEDSLVHLKVAGTIGQRTAVNGRLVLDAFTLEERFGESPAVDETVRHGHRKTWDRLWGGRPPNVAT